MFGRNIKKYRLLKGLSLRELANKINVSHQMIKKYEDEEATPNSERLIEIAKSLDVSIDKLISDYSIPSLEYTNFRKNSSLNKKKEEGLRMLIADEIARYIEVLERADEKYSFNKNEWNYDVNNINDLDTISRKVRKKLGVNDNYPLDNLTDKLEDNNFLILEIDFEENFDGFCEYVDNLAFIVLSSKGYERNRFTLAHELGHLILDFKEELSVEEKERYYNIFASCLLLPEDAMIKELDYKNRAIKHFSLGEIMYIAKEYKVSIQSVIMRLYDLNMIDDNQKRRLFILLSKSGFSKKQLKNIDEHPTRINRIIFRLEAENIINRNEAINYLGVTTNEYFKFNFGN